MYSAPFDGSQNAAIVAKLVREVKANNKTFDTCDISGLFLNFMQIAVVIALKSVSFILAAVHTYYHTKSQEKSLRDRGLLGKRNKGRRHRESC